MDRDIRIKVKVQCVACGGDGIANDRTKCGPCKGTGMKKRWMDAREFLEKYIAHLKSTES